MVATRMFHAPGAPVVAGHGYKCHTALPPNPKGGLLPDTIAGICRGGDCGLLFAPGKPAQNSLVTALRPEEAALPPAGMLPDAVVNDAGARVGRDFRLTDVHGAVVKDILA